MKIILSALILFGSFLSSKAQLTTFYVKPSTINAGYDVAQDSHYVALNPSVTSNGKLLVFFPGTGALTKHYTLFPKLAANLGYHCISIAYPNEFPTIAQACAGNADQDCYHDMREEICYGNDVSTHTDVNEFNSIHHRIVTLLQYLISNHPAQGWDAFLNNDEPVWSLLAVSGHSQGSGHALYLAKLNSCERLIMFAGANDYSNYYSSPANWVSTSGLTNTERYFSFLHRWDDVWEYEKQYAVVQATGMTAYGDDSTLVDDLTSPYANSHCLYSTRTPLYPGLTGAEHNGIVVDFYTPLSGGIPVYQPVWTYMLSETVINKVADAYSLNVQLYPNPVSDQLTVNCATASEQTSVVLMNVYGSTLLEGVIANGQCILNTGALSPGVYTVNVGEGRACIKVVK